MSKKNSINTHQAIIRGQLLVNVPVMIIMISVGVGLYQLSTHKLVHTLFFLPGTFIISPLIAGIYWSFAITHWRIWAFSRVDDLLELKQMAIDGGLIWQDGSSFERTEIRTRKQKDLILEFEKKIREQKTRTEETENVGRTSDYP